MSRYITTKADFTLRRKHKKGSGATIYENDYTTINPMPNALKGEYVIGDSNFVFTSRLGINGQKKHVRGKFLPNPMGEESAWTIDTIIDSGITEETRVRLKPNYTSIRDFACYGSAVKLIQGTVNGVITDFPAEMYLSDDVMTFYGPDPGQAGYSIYDSYEDDSGNTHEKSSATTISGKVLYNEYGIDITSKGIQSESVLNPLRYFELCGNSYTYIEDGKEYEFVGFTVTPTAIGTCSGGKSVWIDKIFDVVLSFSGDSTEKKVPISIFKDYEDGETYYIYGSESGATDNTCIRPNKQIIEEYFRTCDDFTYVLLDRSSKPIYTSAFDVPKETETGVKYEMQSFTWPTFNGGFNPDLSGAYSSYVNGLMNVAEFYDEYFTDNMWRSLTHEAIKTLDWTYISNSDGDIEDLSAIDTSRVEPIVKLYGRQFDNLKLYADAIKSINTITYNQKGNTPDYTLTDVLSNSGWETKTLKLTNDNDLHTETLYSGLTSGYTASDANNEFLRRLKLNSQYLFSIKGTRKGLDTMLAMFGFTPDEYSIHEFVYVASGKSGDYMKFCADTQGKSFPYPLAKDVSTINKFKINFNALDPYGDYCGIPVAEIGFFSGDTDLSYVVPWYSQGKSYDDGLYFQMHGGWGKRKEKKIDLDIAPGISSITETVEVKLYDETQARLKFAKDFDDLLQEAYAGSKVNDVFYVTDIGKILDCYNFKNNEGTTGLSHYFILENNDLNQFLGYSTDIGTYGWRNIKEGEITENSTQAGTLVLYLESIKDDTAGNNPHIGDGTYDDGISYVESITDIFGHSLISNNFIGIDDATCSGIAGYTFYKEKQEDNRKCWFFSDNYNSSLGKDGENIVFREVDVTSASCSGNVFYDVQEVLTTAGENEQVEIGRLAKNYFLSGDAYTRGSSANTFDPEANNHGSHGEAAANSVINVKNMIVNFNLSKIVEGDSSLFGELIDYINITVIPYLTQMIPSTTILSWSFNGDNGGGDATLRYLTITPTSSTALNTETIKLTTILNTIVGGVKNTNIVNANTWVSSNPQVTVSGGICSTNADERVTATITATYDGLSASAQVTFIPDDSKVNVEILGSLKQKNDENVSVHVSGILKQVESIKIVDEEIYIDGELEQGASTDPETEEEVFVEGDLTQEEYGPEPEEEVFVEGDLTQEEYDPEEEGDDPEPEEENVNISGTIKQVNEN